MESLKINLFSPCEKCGDCCGTPCDLIPSNLEPLLDKFQMTLEEFYKQYLIALLVAHEKDPRVALMMVPVLCDSNGVSEQKYLADSEYISKKGGSFKCIFLENNLCKIHDIIPFGGKFLECHKMTGSVDLQLYKSQYFIFWANNQHLFEIVFPGFDCIYSKLIKVFEDKRRLRGRFPRTVKPMKIPGYSELVEKGNQIIRDELFPLFNEKPPVGGFAVYTID